MQKLLSFTQKCINFKVFARQDFRAYFVTTLILLTNACSKQHTPSKLEQIKQRGTLNVVTRNSPTTYYENADGFAGVEYELVTQFAESLGVKPNFIVNDNLKEISDMVNSGEVDFAAAGLTVTPQREQNLRFAPTYQRITSKLVFKQGKKWPRNISQLEGELRVVAHSSYSQELLKLKPKYPQLHWSETTEQTAEELLMMVLDETIDYTIVDSTELALNRRFHPELAVAFTIGKPQSLAWAFSQTDDYSLFSKAIEFFGQQNANGKISHIQEKYYSHVEKFDYVGARQFHRAAQKKLDQYKNYFVNAAGEDIDWRLLAAVSYQESHWKPKAKSPTGVRGMMMLTLNTARQLGVTNRLDVKQSINGGAKYFRKVKRRVPDRIEEPDRTWFALAGYNVGWGHVEDARIITQMQGGNADKWSEVKERLPLLQKKKWYKKTKHGYARGGEPVKYVTNIRRYYDVLVWLDEEQQAPEPTPEEKNQETRVASKQSDAEEVTVNP
ncbi:membrane-bound lytic murein transglycosylase MltF [Aliikangiella coralliicola]|uniref:Membrane-bound lytic murein transglycosylase F n=1 Tax=Aliikangiella coralliicola TaxID=2592383 RepID=A0A545UAP7_9GAMM|nr:membrane-bound lytic murein transglycosylase MltF [Aliikangiella coralliicola]TQV86544.1 membrane-bound lytic murein transglycosylase MltF [Aliikangiella coralliicola]